MLFSSNKYKKLQIWIRIVTEEKKKNYTQDLSRQLNSRFRDFLAIRAVYFG